MFKTDQGKKKIQSLGKNPLNYESTRHESSVFEQKPVKIDKFNEVEKKEIKERLQGLLLNYDGHSFFQNVQSLMQISEIKPKIQKEFFVSQIIAFEQIAVNSLYYKENICDRQSIC